MVVEVSDGNAEDEEEEDDIPEELLEKEITAAAFTQVGDIVIVVVSPMAMTLKCAETMPVVGDAVEFESGIIGYAVAISDLCFSVALDDPTAVVKEGETYTIRQRLRPTVRRPKGKGGIIDWRGAAVGEDGQPRPPEDGEEHTIFNDIIGIASRQRINSSMHSGVMALDSFVPIGRGQSMLLRMPAGMTDKQMMDLKAHVVKAQGQNDMLCVTVALSRSHAESLREDLAKDGLEDRLLIVTGRSENPKFGELMLAYNAACSIAEAHRDVGGDALLLLDLEPMSHTWTALAQVSVDHGLVEVARKDEKKNIETIPEESGLHLWRYVAEKNAISARRRTFMGCFLQRAARMSEEKRNGSLTILAFARAKDTTRVTRKDLETKLKNVNEMALDEALRAKAIEKLEKQIADMAEDTEMTGCPESFLEEAKAVTDGHVVFLESAKGQAGGPARWTVDLRESLARGITSKNVQSHLLDVLRTLNLKISLIARDENDNLVSRAEEDFRMDAEPLLALMQQPVGDVLSVEEEGALYLLALSTAKHAQAAKPLALEAIELLARARFRDLDRESEATRIENGVKDWAEARSATALAELDAGAIEELADMLALKPLERKRVLAAFAGEEAPEGAEEIKPLVLVSKDYATRYTKLRERLASLAEGGFLEGLANPDISDEDLASSLEALQGRISSLVAPAA